MKEKLIETAIINTIKAIGGYAVKVQSGVLPQTYNDKKRFVHLAPAGTPDIIACLKGKFLAIEVKKDLEEIDTWFKYNEEGKLINRERIRAIKQKETLDMIEDNCGGISMIVCSVEEVLENLRIYNLYN